MTEHAVVGPGLFALLAGLAVVVLFLYLLFGGIHRAFQAVGFTREEAGLLLLGSFLGGAFNIPLFVVNDWFLHINVGGALVPMFVTYLLVKRNPGLVYEILVGIVVVSFVTYSITRATPEGIVTYPFAWVLPVMAAAGIGIVSHWRDSRNSAPIAYASGTLGAFIGADVFRLGEFLAQTPPVEGAAASLGGAAVFDMVFLTGILAVLLDMMFFRRHVSEQIPETAAWAKHTVFTSNTPAEAIANWSYTGTERERVQPSRAVTPQPESRPGRPPESRVPSAQRAPPAARPAPQDSRLGAHEEWLRRQQQRL